MQGSFPIRRQKPPGNVALYHDTMAEEEKKLYPLKFLPIAEVFSWGGRNLETRFDKSFIISDLQGNEKPLPKHSAAAAAERHTAESLEIADLGYRDSQVLEGWLAGNTIGELMDMYLDRIVGENVFEFFGRQFPLCIRFIDAGRRTPLMVHPDDGIAQQRYDHLGKTKFWYILEAGENSRISLGFKSDTSAADFYGACADSSADTLLNTFRPEKGKGYLIKPGTVHCADNVVMLEVAQSSPLDFCLCDWGCAPDEIEFDPSLNLEEALDFIDLKAYREPQMTFHTPSVSRDITPLGRCREFTVNRIDLRNVLHIHSGDSGSFIIYSCIAGEAEIRYRDTDASASRPACSSTPHSGSATPDASASRPACSIGFEDALLSRCILRAGETVLVPAEVEDFFLVPRKSGTSLIETFIEHLEEKDSYTGLILRRDTGEE